MKYYKQLPGTPIDPNKLNANLDIASNELDNIDKKINSLMVTIGRGVQENREELYNNLKLLSDTKNEMIGKISYYKYLISKYNEQFRQVVSNNNEIKDYLNVLGTLIQNQETFDEVSRNLPIPPESISNIEDLGDMPEESMIISPSYEGIKLNPNNQQFSQDFSAFVNQKNHSFNYNIISPIEETDGLEIDGTEADVKNLDMSGIYNIRQIFDKEVPYQGFTIKLKQETNDENGEDQILINGINLVPQSNSYSKFYDLNLGEYIIESIRIEGNDTVRNEVINKRVYSMSDEQFYFDPIEAKTVEINIIQPNYHKRLTIDNKEEFVYDVGFYFISLLMVNDDKNSDTEQFSFALTQNDIEDFVVNGDVNESDIRLVDQNGNSIIGNSYNGEIIRCEVLKDNFNINNIVIFYN